MRNSVPSSRRAFPLKKFRPVSQFSIVTRPLIKNSSLRLPAFSLLHYFLTSLLLSPCSATVSPLNLRRPSPLVHRFLPPQRRPLPRHGLPRFSHFYVVTGVSLRW